MHPNALAAVLSLQPLARILSFTSSCIVGLVITCCCFSVVGIVLRVSANGLKRVDSGYTTTKTNRMATTSHTNTYAEKISHLMKTRGLSVREFARGLGRDPGNTHSLIKGSVSPHPSTQKKVADFFGLTVPQLFDPKIPLPKWTAKTDVSETELRRQLEQMDAELLAQMKDELDNSTASRIMAKLILAEREIARLNRIIDSITSVPKFISIHPVGHSRPDEQALNQKLTEGDSLADAKRVRKSR